VEASTDVEVFTAETAGVSTVVEAVTVVEVTDDSFPSESSSRNGEKRV
jgi:hypothetical protein